MSNKTFVHLHTHTGYSILDGMSKVEDLAQRAHEHGAPALAITDHGTMGGILSLALECERQGIKPIPGIEFYHTADRMAGPKRAKGEKGNHHLTALAVTTKGYHNLLELSSKAQVESKHGKWAFVDDDLLSEHGEGIILTSGCMGSKVYQLLMDGKYEEARAQAAAHRDIVGRDHYFIELMNHGIQAQYDTMGDLLRLSKDLGVELLATNDSHYTNQEDALGHDTLLCVQTGKKLSDEDRFRFSGDHAYYMKSPGEMWDLFPEIDFPGACDNTMRIAEECDVHIPVGEEYLLPKYDLSGTPELESITVVAKDNKTAVSTEVLRNKVTEQAKVTYGDPIPDDVQARLDHELAIIDNMGFPDYFLILSDIVEWAHDHGINTGPARGSAAGSLVTYMCGITSVDPLKYDLLFERFLNPHRAGMPDIDVDFDPYRSDEVIQYVVDKYGADHVSLIATYGFLKVKSSIKDAARAMGYPPSVSTALSDLIPAADMTGWKNSLGDYAASPCPAHVKGNEKQYAIWKGGSDFRDEVGKNPAYRDIVERAELIEGCIRTTGEHPSGVIVTPGKLWDYMPVRQKGKKTETSVNLPVSEWDMAASEKIGALKFDFLKIVNLTIIDRTLQLIREDTGKDIDLGSLTFDDPEVYAMLARGESAGVFQLESDAAQQMLRQVGVDGFHDLYNISAINRPGPLASGMDESYALRKRGAEAKTLISPTLDAKMSEETKRELGPVLEDSYGLCVPGDTQIFSVDQGGNIDIEDVVAGATVTPSLNEDTGRLENKTVTGLVQTGEKTVLGVKFGNGRSVRVSDTHPVLTDRGWVPAGELSVGDRVRINKEEISGVGNSDRMESDLAWLIGVMIGDGSMVDGNQPYITNKDDDILEEAERVVLSNFDNTFCSLKDRIRDGNTFVKVLTFHSGVNGKCGRGNKAPESEVGRWLSNFGYHGKINMWDKEISPSILGMDNSTLAHVVAGMWDTDGCSYGYQIEYTTTSERLRDTLLLALDRLGVPVVRSREYPYQNNTREDQVAYRIYPERDGFMRVINPLLRCSRKHSVNTTRTSSSPIVSPMVFSDEIYREFTDWVVSSGRIAEFIPRVQNNVNLRGMTIGKTAMTTFIRRDSGIPDLNLYSCVKYMADNGMISESLASKALSPYTTVESVVNDGVEMCYDIEVEDNHNFLNNGVFLHNCVMQEQIMLVAQIVAGYSMAEADNFRRVVSKKKEKDLKAMQPEFFRKGMERGNSEEFMQELWDIILPFSDYCFNKSHAVGYAYLSYHTAWLKRHYTAHYTAACVDYFPKEKVPLQIASARSLATDVSAPNVNRSEYLSTAKGDRVFLGLGLINGIGESVVNKFVDLRKEGGEFTSFDDFVGRVQGVFSESQIESLVKVGAFSDFTDNPRALAVILPDVFAQAKKSREKAKKTASNDLVDLFGGFGDTESDDVVDGGPVVFTPIPKIEPWDDKTMNGFAREKVGFILGDHPCAPLRKSGLPKGIVFPDSLTIEESGRRVKVLGLCENVEKRVSQKGNKFCTFTLDGGGGSVSAVIFNCEYLPDGEVMVVEAKVEEDRFGGHDDSVKLVCDSYDDEVDVDKLASSAPRKISAAERAVKDSAPAHRRGRSGRGTATIRTGGVDSVASKKKGRRRLNLDDDGRVSTSESERATEVVLPTEEDPGTGVGASGNPDLVPDSAHDDVHAGTEPTVAQDGDAVDGLGVSGAPVNEADSAPGTIVVRVKAGSDMGRIAGALSVAITPLGSTLKLEVAGVVTTAPFTIDVDVVDWGALSTMVDVVGWE